MKRPKIKLSKTAPINHPRQIERFDRLTTLISETNADPDYERAKQIFAELLQETN